MKNKKSYTKAIITPGQLIDKVKKDLFAYTTANTINVIFEFNIHPSTGALSWTDQKGSKMTLFLRLVRTQGANIQEQKK